MGQELGASADVNFPQVSQRPSQKHTCETRLLRGLRRRKQFGNIPNPRGIP
jgi:hypothetical protein